jgi:hypothetical protein
MSRPASTFAPGRGSSVLLRGPDATLRYMARLMLLGRQFAVEPRGEDFLVSHPGPMVTPIPADPKAAA